MTTSICKRSLISKVLRTIASGPRMDCCPKSVGMSWCLVSRTHTLSTRPSLTPTPMDPASMDRIAEHGTQGSISRQRRPRSLFTNRLNTPKSIVSKTASRMTITWQTSAEVFTICGEGSEFKSALDPESYIASQELAEQLLEAGSLGVVYRSVRRTGGTCLACFRPALVGNVRKDKRYRFTWAGKTMPEITCESTVEA